MKPLRNSETRELVPFVDIHHFRVEIGDIPRTRVNELLNQDAFLKAQRSAGLAKVRRSKYLTVIEFDLACKPVDVEEFFYHLRRELFPSMEGELTAHFLQSEKESAAA